MGIGSEFGPDIDDPEQRRQIVDGERAKRDAARLPYLAHDRTTSVLSRIATRGNAQFEGLANYLAGSGLAARPDLVFGRGRDRRRARRGLGWGRGLCPFGNRAGGWVIQVPAVVCTNSPNTVKRLTLRRHDGGASGVSPPAPPIVSAALARTRERSPAQITVGSTRPGTRSPRHRGRCRSTAQHVDPAS